MIKFKLLSSTESIILINFQFIYLDKSINQQTNEEKIIYFRKILNQSPFLTIDLIQCCMLIAQNIHYAEKNSEPKDLSVSIGVRIKSNNSYGKRKADEEKGEKKRE